MNNIDRHIQAVKSVQLSPEERSLMRRNLEYFMDQHPVVSRGFWRTITALMQAHARTVAIASLTIIIIGSSYGAYQAANSPERQMERDMALIEQQMQEVEQLATDLGW